jgi:Neuraminidase (sialidase)
LIRLRDGRLCLTYGHRSKPFGIFAKLSRDNGHTWSAPIILRDDGAAWDLGYVRSVERPDGKVVSVYYFNDAPSSERFIAATIWSPDEGKP